MIFQLLVNGKVPSNVNDAFGTWFDNMSLANFNILWADDVVKTTIESRLRYPNGYHEWFKISQTAIFKSWNISRAEIQRFRTLTTELEWTVPNDIPDIGGLPGNHGGTGSTTFHNEMDAFIVNCNNLAEFNSELENLLTRWSIPVESLPPFPE